MKKKFFLLLCSFLWLSVIGYIMLEGNLNRNQSSIQEKEIVQFPINLGFEHLVKQYKQSFSYVDIYQDDTRVVINVYSDGLIDKPNQFVVETKNRIQENNINISWLNSDEKKLTEENENPIFVHVKIIDESSTLFDETVSLVESGWQKANQSVK